MNSKSKRPPRRRPRQAPGIPISSAPTPRKKRKSTNKPRRPKSINPRRRKLSAWLALVIMGFCFVTLCCYLWMNSKVTKYLVAAETESSSTIFYRPRKIVAKKIQNLNQIENYLQSVGYHSTQERPKTPGEFQRAKKWIKVYSREFNGETNSFPAAQLQFSQGRILNAAGESIEQAFLEPRALKELSGKQKARQFVSLDNIPKHVIQAVLASEDHRFYSHFGVDIVGMLRAIFVNLLSFRFSQGGSTITQQLVKNTLLYPRKTLLRKYLEVLAAISLENKLSKDRILELYLNEVYLGQEGATAIHGLNAASRTFYDKNIEELKTHEAALLAGIIKAPSYFSPRRHPERAKEQRNLVLKKLVGLDWISQKQYKQELKSSSQIFAASRSAAQQNYFIEYLNRELGQIDSTTPEVRAEIKIISGLDSQLQDCGVAAVSSGLAELKKKHPRLSEYQNDLQASLVVIEPVSGMIRAWVGGSDFKKSQFDRVWQSKRQIGSLVKPFVYLTALDASLNDYPPATADSILLDDQVRIKLAGRKYWEPKNYDKEYRGQVTLRYALENSLNIPTVYLSQRIGLASVAKTLVKFGLIKKPEIFPSTVLGSLESNLLSITAAYSALANGGRYVKPRAFSRVYNLRDDQITRSEYSERKVADEAATFVLTNILQGAVERGTGKAIRALGFSAPAAGKTGTTNELRDAWFVGYTPTLIAGVWVGIDSNKPLGLTGGAAAAPIWAELMKCAQENEAISGTSNFIAPRSVLTKQIDSQTGALANDDCPAEQVVQEMYVAGTEPIDVCGEH